MNIELLRATNLRCFERVDFAPGPGINWLVGPNGAGKTTLLEAAYVLSHGRSFRAGGRSAPRRHGAHDYVVYAEIASRTGVRSRLGLTRTEDRWVARRDGADLSNLAPLFEACPVVYFGPESQGLILGPAEERRNFLDWTVFHVEHASLSVWKAWRRTLRQRNALIRQNAPDADFTVWERDLARLADRIDVMRVHCLDSLMAYLAEEAKALVPDLGEIRVDYHPGWDRTIGLAGQLVQTRSRDRERGFTQHGAHRADWTLSFANIAQRQHFSRGQAKAAALVCVLALARWLNDRIGEYPLLCVDDVESELDQRHAEVIIDWIARRPIQGWLTSTHPVGTGWCPHDTRVFHVEHARCEPVDRVADRAAETRNV